MLLHKFSHMGLKYSDNLILIVFSCLCVSDGLNVAEKTDVQSRLGGLATFVVYCKCDFDFSGDSFPLLWTAAFLCSY